jgi:hypothetical protein
LPSDTSSASADGLLDRRVGVDAVLVVEVDAIGPQPLQRALDGSADVRGAAVEHSRTAARVRMEAELRRQHDVVAPPRQGAGEELLVDERAVDLGRVKERCFMRVPPVRGWHSANRESSEAESPC